MTTPLLSELAKVRTAVDAYEASLVEVNQPRGILEHAADVARCRDARARAEYSAIQFILTHAAAIEGMARKAAIWDAFCAEAECGVFPVALLDDAKNMGAGVFEIHFCEPCGTDEQPVTDTALAPDTALRGEGNG